MGRIDIFNKKYFIDCIIGIFVAILKGKIGEAYNIGNTLESITIREYAETLAKLGKVELKFELPSYQEKIGYTSKTNSTLDSKKLQNLGWNNKVSLVDGIKRILDTLKYY